VLNKKKIYFHELVSHNCRGISILQLKFLFLYVTFLYRKVTKRIAVYNGSANIPLANPADQWQVSKTAQ